MTEIYLNINVDKDATSGTEMELWLAKTEMKNGALAAQGTTELIALRNLLEMITDQIRDTMIRGISEFKTSAVYGQEK